jgi:hypothetical protein
MNGGTETMLPDKCKMRAQSRYSSDLDCERCGLGEGDVCPEYLAQSDASIAEKRAAAPNPETSSDLVKRLEWRRSFSGMTRADSIVGCYEIWTYHDAGEWFWKREGSSERAVADEEVARSEAQADYAARILSAIDATTIERLTEAVDCRDMLLDQMKSRAEAAESLAARQAEALKEIESHIEALRPLKTAPAVVGVINWLHRLAATESSNG